MNIGHDNGSTGARDHNPDPRAFEDTLRQLHARAVEHVPLRTLLQLRPRGDAARTTARPRLFAWPLAAACAIALVAGGLFLRHPNQTIPEEAAPAVAITDGETGDVYAALDESPELYLWLASNDPTSLAME
ncbi:hypothetical protein ACFPOA_15270 [Lysobacter niabensis]|uniref:hypothetical protein n=1 Tax=Agrilutibacter niabensis TaxID=380628 RepID=UPI00361D2750